MWEPDGSGARLISEEICALYEKRGSMRRGQAEIIGGIIVFAVLVIVLIPFALNLLSSQGEAAKRHAEVGAYQMEKIGEKVSVTWLRRTDPRAPALWINNTGTIAVVVKYLLLVDTVRQEVLLVNLTGYQGGRYGPVESIEKLRGSSLVSVGRGPLQLSPGEAALVRMARDVEINTRTTSPLVFSERGVLHSTFGRGRGVEAPDSLLLRGRMVLLEDIFESDRFHLKEGQQYFNNDRPTVGISSYDRGGTRFYYRLERSYVNVQLNERIEVTGVIIGFKPKSPNKYNLLIAGKIGGKDYRIKVEGFEPSASFVFQYESYDDRDNKVVLTIRPDNLRYSVGIYPFAKPYSSYIQLAGRAESVKFFERVQTWENRISSYDPFVMIADIGGNGLAELIFSTEDRRFQPHSRWQRDCYPDEEGTHFDHSARVTSGGIGPDHEWGFTFAIGEEVIDPSVHAGVQITFRMYFRDTEDEDLYCTDMGHLPILKVMLVTSDWRVVSSRSIYYWELAPLENTWPPTRDFFPFYVTLFVPPIASDNLYVAISLIDPFYHNRNTERFGEMNDLDLTIALELVSLTAIERNS